MTTTQTTAPRIGTCNWNAAHRFIATETIDQSACCPLCEPVTVDCNGRPWTQRAGIKWATIKARTTTTRCSEVCTSAHSDKCSCECGGRNHGKSLGLAY